MLWSMPWPQGWTASWNWDSGGRALHEATLTILALQRHHAEKSRYPASLGELVQAGYLDTLPADPYAAGPPAYKTVNQDFVLYSLGPNFKDNGGRSGTDRQGRPHMWADKGDTVFWPVQEPQL